MSCQEVGLGEDENKIGLHLSYGGEAVPVTGIGLWIDRYGCSGGTSLIAS